MLLYTIRTLGIALLAVGLSACFNGHGLRKDTSLSADIESAMGTPTLRWIDASGRQTWVYPTGPMGFHTWFVHLDSDGRFTRRENVLEASHFSKIKAGLNEEEVIRQLGPPVANWTMYFAARDELVWEWRYCNEWLEPARFNVMFDATTRRVRSTYAASEGLRGIIGFGQRRSWCSH